MTDLSELLDLTEENARLKIEIERLQERLAKADSHEEWKNGLTDMWRDRAERYREALESIDRWAKAYPLEVFPEPTKDDWRKARKLLEAGGLTLDAISASSMRHVVEVVGKIARDALGTP